MNNTNTMRPRLSLNSFPPVATGSTVYHSVYAGSSQKYTSGWPNHQNSVRASTGSTVGTMPSDHGMSSAIISIATPIVASSQTMTVAIIPNIGSGTASFGFLRRHTRYVSTITPHQIQDPTTRSVAPM